MGAQASASWSRSCCLQCEQAASQRAGLFCRTFPGSRSCPPCSSVSLCAFPSGGFTLLSVSTRVWCLALRTVPAIRVDTLCQMLVGQLAAAWLITPSQIERQSEGKNAGIMETRGHPSQHDLQTLIVSAHSRCLANTSNR